MAPYRYGFFRTNKREVNHILRTWDCGQYRPCVRARSAGDGYRSIPSGALSGSDCFSVSKGWLLLARANRLETRSTWVSTARAGTPKALLSTTLAVFRPTPGNASKSLPRYSTFPPWESTRIRQVDRMFRLLFRNKPNPRISSAPFPLPSKAGKPPVKGIWQTAFPSQCLPDDPSIGQKG